VGGSSAAIAAGELGGNEQKAEANIRFKTVSDAVKQAKNDFSGPLVFLDNAVYSAENSPYQEPERVYELFEALFVVAGDWKKKKEKLGRKWKDAICELGFDLRDRISKTTKTKYANDYSL